MKSMIITGAQLKNFKVSQKGDGFLSVVKTTYKNKQQKGHFIGVILSGERLEEFQSSGITVGKGLNICGGDVTISQTTDKDGSIRPQIILKNPNVEEAQASGSGLLQVIFTNVRITEEPVEKDNCVNCKAVINYKEGSEDKAMWLYLTFWGDKASRAKAMKLKKGSTIDIDADIDVSIYTDDNGNNYLNIYLNANNMSYSAIPKSTETPAPTAPATPVAQPAAPVVEDGPTMEQMSQASPIMNPDSQSDNDVQDSDLEEEENIYF